MGSSSCQVTCFCLGSSVSRSGLESTLAGVLHEPQPPSGQIRLFHHGLLHRLQLGNLIYHDTTWAAGGQPASPRPSPQFLHKGTSPAPVAPPPPPPSLSSLTMVSAELFYYSISPSLDPSIIYLFIYFIGPALASSRTLI